MIGPGDKVVCVDDFTYGGGHWPLKRGEIYTVRRVVVSGPATHSPPNADEFDLELEEIRNPSAFRDGWAACRFRKLDIEQFRDMARNADTLPVTERKEVTV